MRPLLLFVLALCDNPFSLMVQRISIQTTSSHYLLCADAFQTPPRFAAVHSRGTLSGGRSRIFQPINDSHRLSSSSSVHEYYRRRQQRWRLYGSSAAVVTSPLVGYFYMLLLALQFAFQPILTKRFAPTNIVRTTYVLAQECVRLIIGVSLLLATQSWESAVTNWTISAALAAVGFPTVLYLLQNYCSLMAYQHLPPITYNVLNQTKTLSAAIFCFCLLGQRQSPMQMLALLILLFSALVMESIVPLPFMGHKTKKNTKETEKSPEQQDDTHIAGTQREYLLFGIIPILTASSISGLAGAWVQKSLKQRNSLLFSVELAVLSIYMLVVRAILDHFWFRTRTTDSETQRRTPMTGWTWETWIPVWTNASGGILVGLVTKHAGAVRKGFALILGMFLSGLLQNWFWNDEEAKRVSAHQWVGGVLAATSLWMHSSFPR